MNWRLVSFAAALSLAGCFNPDSDGDGISNREEAELGLDPDSTDSDGDGIDDFAEIEAGYDPLSDDSDGDGLLDGEELDEGSDPLEVDTDGDGYDDFAEVKEGSDPADEDDVIYVGGWPYSHDKEDLGAAGMSGVVAEGDLHAWIELKDQFGDTVDLYDFYEEEGVDYIVVDVSAQWCPPCQAVSLWLDNDSVYGPALDAYWPTTRDRVEDGSVRWLTILGENTAGNGAKQKNAEQWYEEFPNPHIPVLADPDYAFVDYYQLRAWPTFIVLHPDLTVAYVPPEGYWEALDWLESK